MFRHGPQGNGHVLDLSAVTFPVGLRSLKASGRNIVPPTASLPIGLRKVHIIANDILSQVALSGVSGWHLHDDLRELKVGCGRLESPCVLPTRLRDFQLDLVESNEGDNRMIDIHSLHLPDSLVNLKMSANDISFAGAEVEWPSALKALTVTCDEWSTPLPETLLHFDYGNYLGRSAIPQGFEFPDSVGSIFLHFEGDYTGGEPVWPQGLKKLTLFALSDMFTITSLPPRLSELYISGIGVEFGESCVFPRGLVVGIPMGEFAAEYRVGCNLPKGVLVRNVSLNYLDLRADGAGVSA